MRKLLIVGAGAFLFVPGTARSETFEQQVLQISRTAAAGALQTRQSFAASQTQSAGPSASDREILQAVRRAYDNPAAAAGFGGFFANARIDWPYHFGRPLTSGERTVFDDLKFELGVDERGAVQVEPKSAIHPEPSAEDQKIAAFLQKGMAEFFDQWTYFMNAGFVPGGNHDFQLKQEGNLYRLTYESHGGEVSVTLLNNFAVTKVEIATKDFRAAVQPRFTSTEHGLLLTGYDAVQNWTDGSIVSAKAKIEYQEAAGFRLPKTITMDGATKLKFDLDGFSIRKPHPQAN